MLRERSLVMIVGGGWWGVLCLLDSKYAIVLCDDQLWMVLHSHPFWSLGLSFVWGEKEHKEQQGHERREKPNKLH